MLLQYREGCGADQASAPLEPTKRMLALPQDEFVAIPRLT